MPTPTIIVYYIYFSILEFIESEMNATRMEIVAIQSIGTSHIHSNRRKELKQFHYYDVLHIRRTMKCVQRQLYIWVMGIVVSFCSESWQCVQSAVYIVCGWRRSICIVVKYVICIRQLWTFKLFIKNSVFLPFRTILGISMYSQGAPNVMSETKKKSAKKATIIVVAILIKLMIQM